VAGRDALKVLLARMRVASNAGNTVDVEDLNAVMPFKWLMSESDIAFVDSCAAASLKASAASVSSAEAGGSASLAGKRASAASAGKGVAKKARQAQIDAEVQELFA